MSTMTKKLLIQRAYFLILVEFGGHNIDQSEIATLLNCDMDSDDFEKWLDEQNERTAFETWIKENNLEEFYKEREK